MIMDNIFILEDLDSYNLESVDADLGEASVDELFNDDSFDSSTFLSEELEPSLIGEEDIEHFAFKEPEQNENLVESHIHAAYEPSFQGHSLGGNGRCSVCNCGQWAGFGDTCENCGHFYNKHI